MIGVPVRAATYITAAGIAGQHTAGGETWGAILGAFLMAIICGLSLIFRAMFDFKEDLRVHRELRRR